MKKRLLSLVMVIAMVLSLFGCGDKEDTSKTESLTSTIDFNETGYPIVNEPLKLTVGVFASASYEVEWDDLTWVKALEEASGIDLEFVIYNDGSAMDLMFAGQNFPDILWNVGNSQQIYDAAKGGFIYALDEYMDEYAPNWANYFAENKEALKKVKAEWSFRSRWDLQWPPSVRVQPSDPYARSEVSPEYRKTEDPGW